MHDETQDDKPHVHVHADSVPPADTHESLSIWFFCGILMLAYGIVLVIQGIIDLSNPPHTVLSNLHPTLLWGGVLFLFGAFYTIRFRPGKA
jgi:hypothetical protein